MNSKPLILQYKSITPKVDSSAFIAPMVTIIGDVEIGAESGVWFQSVLRGDVNRIRIGKRTNIQDGTIIHCADKNNGDLPTIVGDNVTVGHMALLHACTIGNDCLIGMKSCVMDGAVVEDGAIVAAGALVTPGKRIKAGQLWAGSPARHVRDVTDDEKKRIEWSAGHYIRLARNYTDE